jgi:hypothetical protein
MQRIVNNAVWSQPMSTAVHMSPNKLCRSNSYLPFDKTHSRKRCSKTIPFIQNCKLINVLFWMRSSLVVRASDCQCTSCNGPGFDPSIRRHSGIWGSADEAVLNIVRKKRKKSPKKYFKKKMYCSGTLFFKDPDISSTYTLIKNGDLIVLHSTISKVWVTSKVYNQLFSWFLKREF